MKAVIIKTDGTRQLTEFKKGQSYDFLSTAVGGMIECVTLRDKVGEPDMWLNENGKYSGLDQNPTATALWVGMYDLTDVIMGDVVITGGADDEGETIGLSDEQVDFFMTYERQIWNTNAPGFISFS